MSSAPVRHADEGAAFSTTNSQKHTKVDVDGFGNHPPFRKGFSLSGLRWVVAEGVKAHPELEGAGTATWWELFWCPQTLPNGWKYVGDLVERKSNIYQEVSTGNKYQYAQDDVHYTRKPLPCATISYAEVVEREHPEFFAVPTHFVSFPSKGMPFPTIIDCIADVLGEYEKTSSARSYVIIDPLNNGWHPLVDANGSCLLPNLQFGSLPGGIIKSTNCGESRSNCLGCGCCGSRTALSTLVNLSSTH